jgi:hypothetical protein
MDYWHVVTRSFRIAWDHKYLWLIALFSGEAGGGFSFNYSQNNRRYKPQDLAAFQDQVGTWIHDHLGLLITLGVVYLVLVVAFFILAAVCEGATVRASAEHDAERPFGLGWAWAAGVRTMWVIVRFRLIILALGLPLIALLAGLAVGIFLTVAHSNFGATLVLVLLAIVLVLAGIPYGIYLSLLDRFGSRAVVLELVGARAAVSRAHRLVFKRFGRSLLVWLVAIVVSLVVSFVLACVLALALLPIIIAIGVMLVSGSQNFWVILIGALLLLPFGLVIGGFLSAQTSTYWTLAFRRMELDPTPQYYYQGPPPPPPPPVTP